MGDTMSVRELEQAGLHLSEGAVWRLSLDVLASWMWGDNPKQHQDAKIDYSIDQFGFNDDIGVDPFLKLVVEGHGRIMRLVTWRDARREPPKNVLVDSTGAWLIPVKPLKFDDRIQALRYALWHNATNTFRVQEQDYNADKMAEVTTNQPSLFDEALFGEFGNAVSGSGPVVPLVELPKKQDTSARGEVFDPGSLTDIPGQVQQRSFLLYMSFPSQDALRRAIGILSFGERKGSLPKDMQYATFNGMAYIDRWDSKLLGNGNEQEDVDVITSATPVADEPEWDESGNCCHCGGAGNTGFSKNNKGEREPIYCTYCYGQGSREKFLQYLSAEAAAEELTESNLVSQE